MSDTIIDIKNSGGVILDTYHKYCDGNIQIKPVLQSKSVTKNGSVVADEGYCGLDSVTVDVPTQKDEEAGTATIITNGTQTFSPTSGKVFSNFTVTTNVPAGVDTSDVTAVASDILSGKTAYAKGVKLIGSVETYNGAFVVKASWKASVSNLGAQDPNTVVFNTPADSVPKPWSEVEFNGDVFIKFPKMYKKIVTVTDNQITAFEIANAKLDDDYKLYPCFIDESGNELDYILVGKYLYGYNPTSGAISPVTLSRGREVAKTKGIGYQLMDWRIQRLWQDLLICAMKTVNTNSKPGTTTDTLGLNWGPNDQWIDGFCCIDTSWMYSNSPSKYIDSPTASSDGYFAISGYAAPIADRKPIKKLGYDSNQPFFNYPSDVVNWSDDYNTYYCDQFMHSKTNRPIFTVVGSFAYSGAFCCQVDYNWESTIGARLCYRPISS